MYNMLSMELIHATFMMHDYKKRFKNVRFVYSVITSAKTEVTGRFGEFEYDGILIDNLFHASRYNIKEKNGHISFSADPMNDTNRMNVNSLFEFKPIMGVN